MHGWWLDGHMSAGGWVLMTLFWIILIGVIVWAVTRIFPGRGTGGDEGRSSLDERPEDILDRRLARGEIDTETYEGLRAKIHAGRAERR